MVLKLWGGTLKWGTEVLQVGCGGSAEKILQKLIKAHGGDGDDDSSFSCDACTGMLPEPEPRTAAPANAPAGRVVIAGPPPPLLGFRKAARTPPLSTAAAAIITSTSWGAARECRANARVAEICAACSCCSCSSRLPAPLCSLEMLIGGADHVTVDLIGGSTSPLPGWDIFTINMASKHDYWNNGRLCTARASEETTPTDESPPPPFPLTTRRQQSPIAPLKPALRNPSTLLVPDIIIPSFIYFTINQL
ncbi:hypothetical protein EYF80_028459 [Liparis tanakae]|uniref:Uncharacterized protein n=1 Tax=Liparis tanakae TaxID=230148 RepID=A0A4Z2H986_9TELE|nr:hypothetical protein EYF80_028459 [Liparis tanakae]